jgi:hypothetical protein
MRLYERLPSSSASWVNWGSPGLDGWPVEWADEGAELLQTELVDFLAGRGYARLNRDLHGRVNLANELQREGSVLERAIERRAWRASSQDQWGIAAGAPGSREALAGYLFYEADDLMRRSNVASKIPAARMGGSVEVRPLKEQ